MTYVGFIAGLTLVSTACAHPQQSATIHGEQTSPGIYSFDGPHGQTEREFGPWAATVYHPSLQTPTEPPAKRSAPAADGPLRATAWLWFRAYQETFSRVDGTTCRFHPTCSGFGLNAVRAHGLYGVIMTFGRLHKNHSDEKHYPMTGPPFLDDPVSNYTFWLRRPRYDDFVAYDDEAHAWYQHVRATSR